MIFDQTAYYAGQVQLADDSFGVLIEKHELYDCECEMGCASLSALLALPPLHVGQFGVIMYLAPQQHSDIINDHEECRMNTK